MFDGIKFILKGFGGYYADQPEGRKLIWAHLAVTFFTGCALVFIAYVSFTRYLDLVSTLLPQPKGVALCFTLAIALFMLSASSYVGVFLVQAWVRDRIQWELSWQGALIFAVAAVLVGTIDFRMNLDGAADLAKRSAGTVVPLDEQAILDRYQHQILPLQQEQDSLMQRYTWKGVTYFKASKYHPEREFAEDKARFDQLASQISQLRDARQQALSTAQNAHQSALQTRDQKESLTFSRLSIAVKYVYFLQFLLCIVGAYISHVLGLALTPGPLVSLPRIPLITRLKGPEKPINTPINTAFQPDAQLESLIFATQGAPVGEELAHADPDAIAFLRKYKPVVRAILDGASYGQIITAHQVSKSTAQNVKRTMRAVRLI